MAAAGRMAACAPAVAEEKRMDYALLPKVDRILSLLEAQPELLPPAYSRAMLTESAREAVAALRAGAMAESGDRESLLHAACQDTLRRYAQKCRPSLRRVINATGIVLHTNLGRSLLADEAVHAVCMAAGGYCNLELDLANGKRGSRYSHVAGLLCELTGAEDALVVNNNAAAVLLALDTLARGGEAIVSRGQLVEIGGSFRVPDVMTHSGVMLCEVGTTNKTHLRDYQAAIRESTSILVQVHPSNFVMRGFVEEVSTAELAALAHSHNLPFLYDLGSGCFYPFAEQGIGHEPLPRHLIAQDVDVLTFSGDKLLGGPQAGIIIGKTRYLARIKANPLTRALRIDKLTLAALEATLRIYRAGQEKERIPTVAMLLADEAEIGARAARLLALLQENDVDGALYQANLRRTVSPVGGGSLPEVELPTVALEVEPQRCSAASLQERLRDCDPALLGYLRENKLLLDLRTVADAEVETVAALLLQTARGMES